MKCGEQVDVCQMQIEQKLWHLSWYVSNVSAVVQLVKCIFKETYNF